MNRVFALAPCVVALNFDGWCRLHGLPDPQDELAFNVDFWQAVVSAASPCEAGVNWN